MNGQLIHFEGGRTQAIIREWAQGEIPQEEFRPDRHQTAFFEDPYSLKQIGEAMREGWKWSWTTDVQDDLNRALRLFEDKTGL